MSGKADLNKLKSGVFSRDWLEISASTLLQCKEFISCLWRVLLLHDFLQMTHRIKKKYKKEEKKSAQHPLTEVLNRHKSTNSNKITRDLHLYKQDHNRPVIFHFWNTADHSKQQALLSNTVPGRISLRPCVKSSVLNYTRQAQSKHAGVWKRPFANTVKKDQLCWPKRESSLRLPRHLHFQWTYSGTVCTLFLAESSTPRSQPSPQEEGMPLLHSWAPGWRASSEHDTLSCKALRSHSRHSTEIRHRG